MCGRASFLSIGWILPFLSSLFQRLRELEPQLLFSCSQICDGAGRAFGEEKEGSPQGLSLQLLI